MDLFYGNITVKLIRKAVQYVGSNIRLNLLELQDESTGEKEGGHGDNGQPEYFQRLFDKFLNYYVQLANIIKISEICSS